jgi:hypothetical protein
MVPTFVIRAGFARPIIAPLFTPMPKLTAAARVHGPRAGHRGFAHRRILEPSNGFSMMHRMSRPLTSTLSRLVAGLLLCSALACAMTRERLPDLDRKFYDNLPSEADKDAFLRLQDTKRQPFLEQKGLWSRWSELTNAERDAVKRGEVKAGHKEFVAFMVWGPPADTQSSKAQTRDVRFHTFIRCTSGPRVGRYVQSNLDCDGTSSEVEIAVENNLITEIKHLN